jgi:hypothetical protein
LSGNGTAMIVGANSHAAYCQNLPKEGWKRTATFQGQADGRSRDDGGVDISADGRRFIIGDALRGGSGRAYIYSDAGGSWINMTLSPLGSDEEWLSSSVAISNDGRVALVGAPGYFTGVGRAYCYQLSADDIAWIPRGDPIEGMARNGFFGHAVSLTYDGARMSKFILQVR